MKYLPKNTLTGNIYAASVEDFNFGEGKSGVNFKFITKRVWKDKEGNKKEGKAFFHKCVAFGQSAEIIKAAAQTKGIVVSFEPEFILDTWEKDGVTKYATKVRVNWVKAYAWNDATKEWEEQELADVTPGSAAVAEEDQNLPF